MFRPGNGIIRAETLALAISSICAGGSYRLHCGRKSRQQSSATDRIAQLHDIIGKTPPTHRTSSVKSVRYLAPSPKVTPFLICDCVTNFNKHSSLEMVSHGVGTMPYVLRRHVPFGVKFDAPVASMGPLHFNFLNCLLPPSGGTRKPHTRTPGPYYNSCTSLPIGCH